MKEEFKSDHWKDFAQRYAQTYGWFENEGKKKLLVFLSKVEENQLTFLDKWGIAYYARPDKDNFFTFLPVERGCYNYGEDDVVVTRRHPARQWKRGLCADNTIIHSLGQKANLIISFTLLEEIFTESINRALERFKLTKIGNVAFNRTIALVNNQLYIYNDVIGSYKNGEFHLTNNLFRQEVEDVVRRNMLEIPVITSEPT